jgi:menaquinone-dependent protoporphyrinogen oxidase
MATILVVYATRHGQTARISRHIGDELRRRGHEVTVAQCEELERTSSLRDHDAVLIGGSVYMGRYERSLAQFVRHHRADLDRLPNAFFSVSMAAASSHPRARAQVRRAIAGFRTATGWRPQRTESFAGAVLYREYGTVTRLIMRLISKQAGHGTDPSRNYEYTDWDRVTEFAAAIDDALPAPRRTAPATPRPAHPPL